MAEASGLNIDIDSSAVKGGSRIVLSGYLDADTSNTLSEKFTELLTKKTVKMVVDLKGVTFVSSAGWGILIRLSKDAQKAGGGIVLYNMSPKVERIYRLLDLSPVLPVYGSEVEALKHFEK